MTNRKAALWFAVFGIIVYASGVASGVLLDRILSGGPRPYVAFGGLRPGPNPERLASRLTRELSLTAEQRARVQAILQQRRGLVGRMHRDLREQARRRFVQEQGELRGQIRAVLTPEQQTKFDALVARGPEGFWPGPGRFLGAPPPGGPDPSEP